MLIGFFHTAQRSTCQGPSAVSSRVSRHGSGDQMLAWRSHIVDCPGSEEPHQTNQTGLLLNMSRSHSHHWYYDSSTMTFKKIRSPPSEVRDHSAESESRPIRPQPLQNTQRALQYRAQPCCCCDTIPNIRRQRCPVLAYVHTALADTSPTPQPPSSHKNAPYLPAPSSSRYGIQQAKSGSPVSRQCTIATHKQRSSLTTSPSPLPLSKPDIGLLSCNGRQALE